MKCISIMMLGAMFALQSADLPDDPKKPADLPGNSNKFDITRIDYSKLFRPSGLNDDPTSIFYYFEDKNIDALQRLINQAKKDGRIDVLEKAVRYAIRDKKLNAVSALLDNRAPIRDDIINPTIDFLIEHALRNESQKQLYAREYQTYARIIRSIMQPGQSGEFKTVVDYAIGKRNQSVLVWLLEVAISLQNMQYAMVLIDHYIGILDANYLNQAIQMITAMMNSVDVQYRGKMQDMIDKLNKALRNV